MTTYNTNYNNLSRDVNSDIPNKYTLSQIISRKFPHIEIEQNKNEATEHYELRKIMFSDRRAQNICELKKKCIPHDLIPEVEKLVKRSYKNDWYAYFEDIDLYFIIMTNYKLKIANYDDIELKNLIYSISKTEWKIFKSVRSARLTRRKIINHCAALLKLVGQHRKYICESQEIDYKKSVDKQQKFIKSQSLINADGYKISLASVTKSKEQYIAEKINCIRTMELFAVDKEFEWSFITISLAGEFHPNPKYRGKTVYNGVAPSESAKILANDWNKVRALLRKYDIFPHDNYFGSATSEANGDGVRHMHLLVFMSPAHRKIFRHCFFTVFPNLKFLVEKAEAEKMLIDLQLSRGYINQQEYNKELKNIRNPWIDFDSDKVEDKSKLGAVNYIYKYIMKSVSNFDINLDIWSQDFTPEMQSTIKNCAFRNAIGIRGVSFFGFEACLSKFRFFARNLKKLIAEKAISVQLQMVIEKNDLYAFIKEGHYHCAENVYVTTKSGNRKLVAVEMNNKTYLKNIFKMAKSSVLKGWVNLSNYTKMARLQKIEIEVLINHNVSSKNLKTKVKSEKQNLEIVEDHDFHVLLWKWAGNAESYCKNLILEFEEEAERQKIIIKNKIKSVVTNSNNLGYYDWLEVA